MIIEVKGRTLIVTDSNVKNIYQLDNVSSVKQANGKVVVTFLKDVNFLTLKNITSPVFANDNELVAENIKKRWSSEEGGYWYVANAGDCDGGDTIEYWFGSDADENGYVAEINARI